jgi:DNA-binding response OmpR family regulator
VTLVLVVEDEESFSDALSYLLRKEGFEVVVCPTGPGALDTFDRNGADLVLLDLMLAGPPGTEVCRSLRERSNVAVIMLTAKDTEVDKAVGLELGADDYVTKPFSWRELLARIRAVLRRQGETGELPTAPPGAAPVRTPPTAVPASPTGTHVLPRCHGQPVLRDPGAVHAGVVPALVHLGNVRQLEAARRVFWPLWPRSRSSGGCSGRSGRGRVVTAGRRRLAFTGMTRCRNGRRGTPTPQRQATLSRRGEADSRLAGHRGLRGTLCRGGTADVPGSGWKGSGDECYDGRGTAPEYVEVRARFWGGAAFPRRARRPRQDGAG